MIFNSGGTMARRQQLHKDGIRRTITFRPDIDEKLAVEAARRRVPISAILEELIEHKIEVPRSPEDLARKFPPKWDGTDLRARLAHLQMRQSDLAVLLDVSSKNLSHWITGANPFPAGMLERIQLAVKSWEANPKAQFRLGSCSPKF